jgi:peptide deformylase
MSAAAGRVRRVVLYPADVLRTKCAPIQDVRSPDSRQLFSDLLATVRAEHGLGLASPQIGETRRAFVMRTPIAKTEQEARRLLRPAREALARQPPGFTVVANPEITAKHGVSEERGATAAASAGRKRPAAAGAGPSTPPSPDGMVMGLESCLSVPDHAGLVRRYSSISVRYTGLDGEVVEERLEGLPAVVFQHELDHLDGVLLIDREVTSVPHGGMDEAFDAASRRFTVGLMRFYGDAGEYDEAQKEGRAVLK